MSLAVFVATFGSLLFTVISVCVGFLWRISRKVDRLEVQVEGHGEKLREFGKLKDETLRMLGREEERKDPSGSHPIHPGAGVEIEGTGIVGSLRRRRREPPDESGEVRSKREDDTDPGPEGRRRR